MLGALEPQFGITRDHVLHRDILSPRAGARHITYLSPLHPLSPDSGFFNRSLPPHLYLKLSFISVTAQTDSALTSMVAWPLVAVNLNEHQY
jgi:hypothetical protein